MHFMQFDIPNNFEELSQIIKLTLSILLAGHILVRKQEPVVCLSWLLGLALFPLGAVICYIGFGINPFEKYAARKRRSKHLAGLKLERQSAAEIVQKNRNLMTDCNFMGFDRTAMWVSMLKGQPLQIGNQAEILVNSTNAFSAMNAAIESAENYIFVQFYQIQADKLGLEFLDLLCKKAKSGVRVFVLFDALGSRGITNHIIADCRNKGLKIHRFLDVHPIKRRFQINWRNHRKLLICDGIVAFTGGFNIGEMYLEGADPLRPKWFDLIFKVKGPLIKDLVSIFAEDWHFTTGRTIPDSILSSAKQIVAGSAKSNNLLQIIASGPSENNAPFYSTLISILHEARERVWIMTPYFVPDRELLHAMRMAVVRGVNVRIIVPKRSNHPITDTCAHSYFSEIHSYGVELLRYVPGVCHGKLVLADSDLILAGSSNLDYRSFFLNFETDLFIRDRDLAANISTTLDQVCRQCVPLNSADVSNRRLGRLLFRRLMRLLAPLM